MREPGTVRRRRLLAVVEARGQARVAELAAELEVSVITVRRDVEELARAGKLRRGHGVARSLVPRRDPAPEPRASDGPVALVIPEVRGKFNGISYRVPTPTVSIVDFVVELEKEVTKEDIHQAMKRAGHGRMKGILDVVEEPVVSMDLKGTTFSSVVDALSTQIVDGTMARVASWYDNEWGYACRISDVTAMVAKGQRAATKELAAAAAR